MRVWGRGWWWCRKFTHRFSLKTLMNIFEDFVKEDIKRLTIQQRKI
jgi:hypothetical protein